MPTLTSVFDGERVQTAPQREFTRSGRSETISVVLVFLISTAYLCLFCRYSSLEPDEGIVLQGAERILHGEVPYRDFFSFYTPASYYFVAALFRLLGDSLAIVRASLAVGGGGCAAVVYVLSRRVCSRSISWFAAGLTAIAGVSYRFLVLHNWYSTFLCCFTLYAAVRMLESRRASWAFTTGSLASLTVLVEQSKGAGICIGLAVGFALIAILGRERPPCFQPLFASVGFFWPLLTTAAYFAKKQSLTLMLSDWVWPLKHYAVANHVSYGYQNWSPQERQALFHNGSLGLRLIELIAISPNLIIPFIPLIALALLSYFGVRSRLGQEIPRDRLHYYLLVSAILAGLWISIVIGRADVIHFMYLAPFWYVVMAWLLGAEELNAPWFRSGRAFVITCIAIAFGLMGFALLLSVTGAKFRVETVRGVITTRGQDTVIDYVQAHVAPGSELLVYPYLPLYNYLTATESPAPLDYFQHGMNTPEQGQTIIRSLQSGHAQPVLFEPGFAGKFATAWPGTPAESIRSDPVAEYIVRNYEACATLQSPVGWRFEFRVFRGSACPQDSLKVHD